MEDALSQSRMSAHSADVERNEVKSRGSHVIELHDFLYWQQTEALDRLQKELEALRKQLRQESSQVSGFIHLYDNQDSMNNNNRTLS